MSDAKTYAAAAASNHASDAKQQQSPGKRKGSKILLCHSTSPSSEPNAQPRHQSRLGFGSKKAIWRTTGKDKNNERSNPDQEQEEKQLQKNKDAGAGESPDSFVPGPRYVESPIPFHKPNTNQEEEHVYVLTLQVTESRANPLNEMRGKHFPKHLNRTPAHLTLFHALPHSQLDLIEDNLAVLTWAIKPFHISTGIPFRMQRGVGVGLGDGLDELRDIRDALRFKWLPFLSDQDGGGWQPHWTVMNKVDEPKKVANAFDTIRRDLFENVQEGRAVGLDLWRYDKGSWEWVKEYGFLCNGNGPARISAGSPDLLGGEHRSSRLGSWSTGRKASESSQGKSQRRLDGQDGKVATLWGSLGFGRRS